MKNASYLSMTWLMLWFIVGLMPQGPVARADFSFGTPTKMSKMNTTSGDAYLSIASDGLTLYFASSHPHGGDSCHEDIWVATRSTIDETWGTPTKLDPPIQMDGPKTAPNISADGLELYFNDGWPQSFIGACGPDPRGYGGGDLWVCTRATTGEPWSDPANLGPMVNSPSHDGQSSISSDGLSLYFKSDRGGGYGTADLYVSTRATKHAPWGLAQNLGSAINIVLFDTNPFISPDDLSLYFTRTIGGSSAIYVSRRASVTAPWEAAVPFEFLNPPSSEYGPWFRRGGSTLYFVRSISWSGVSPDAIARTMATMDIWQVEVTAMMDLNGDGAVNTLDIYELESHLGDRDNSLYDIAPSPLGDGVADAKDLLFLVEYVHPSQYPVNRAKEISHDVVLSWEPIESAQTYDVYIGTDYDAVKDASTTDSSYMGRQETSRYDPGQLDFGKPYYWRVDEVNGAPDFSVFRGDVWSFTTEAFSYPIANITAEASGTFGVSVPENTINGSGLADDLHGTSAADMWISASVPATIEYTFDRAYKLHELWVWNSNQLVEFFVGFGAKDVVIEHSLDGKNWTVLDGVGPLAQAPGTDGYAHNNTIDLGGATAQRVRLTINSVQGIAPQASLSEVRFLYIPVKATGPNPKTGATAVAPGVMLSWSRNGREADSHDVYVGTDPNDLSLSGSVSESSFDTLTLDLQLGQTYHWRVDEVNEAMDPSTWIGDVWSFTTVAAIRVDDMERYRDAEFLEIWATWTDGFDDPANGGTVGNGTTGAPETDMVHGGGQSMPLHFDNSVASVSEATRTFDQTQDWTRSGIQALVLYFRRGGDNTGGDVYVKINDTKVVYPETPGNLPPGLDVWTQWNIDLAARGTDLTRVRSLTIGIKGAGATGVLYVDDIELYRDAPAAGAAEVGL